MFNHVINHLYDDGNHEMNDCIVKYLNLTLRWPMSSCYEESGRGA